MIGVPTPRNGVDLTPTAPRLPIVIARSEELATFPSFGRPSRRPRRRLGRYASAMLALVTIVASTAAVARFRAGMKAERPLYADPVLVTPPLRLDGALVRGASRDWVVNQDGPLRYGDPVPVSLTAYCLRGLTRRDHYVREGIVAADPRLFPLGRYLEIYVGKQYYGRFLIDDTGGVIKGNKLDIWSRTCREARLFGRVTGTAVLVPKPRGASRDTLTTGRLGGASVPVMPLALR